MERKIAYNSIVKSTIMGEVTDSSIINMKFLSSLYKKLDIESTGAIKELYDNIGEETNDNYWYVFGYKYIGFVLLDLFKFLLHNNRIKVQTDHNLWIWDKILNISDNEFSELLINEHDIEDFVSQFNNLNKSYITEIIKCTCGLWDDKAWVGYEVYFDKIKYIHTKLNEGIRQFANACTKKDVLYAIDKLLSETVFQYLSNDISKYDEMLLQQIPVLKMIGDKRLIYPLSRKDEMSIGIVNPWPGDKSAEAEVLSRMKVGADDIGLGYVMLDNFGHVLDDTTQKMLDQYVDPKDLDFVITTHYESEKTVDAFYYHTLWNPPEIPLNLGDYDTRITNNYLMNDDYLIYDFGGMSNHLRGMLMNKPRTIEGASMLTASFPKSKMLAPKLENPKLFYCGMNWEKVVHNSNRHEGLFKLLDETGAVKFFGPDKVEAWGGMRPWAGYQCYQYPIPFDGFSILKEINECGICLVLSSDIHRRAGAATNRTYEACAAGAVIISDNNEFMQHYFKDAALFIEYNKNNPKDTFDQIMDKYHWIVEHKNEALHMAIRAQKVFEEHFTVDQQLLEIVNHHANRFHTISQDLFATNEKGRVLVSYVVNTLDIDKAKIDLKKVFDNIGNQWYRNIIIGIICDQSISNEIERFAIAENASFELLSLQLFDNKKSRQYTDGQVLRLLQTEVEHDYFMNTFAHEQWFYDHVTTLIRTMEDENAVCSYSGRLHKDAQGYARSDFFENIHLSTVINMNCPDWLPVPGQLLFKKSSHAYLPDYLFDCLDGYEHYAYVCVLWLKNKLKIAFSKRMTMYWSAQDIDARCSVLKAEYQTRFIRDIVKFDIPEGVSSGSTSKETLRAYAAWLPIKAWTLMRLYKILLRLFRFDSKIGKRILDKYNKAESKFFSW